MSTQLLIYERAVAVNKQKHKDWSVKTGKSYDFAKNINSVPLTAVEFPVQRQSTVLFLLETKML